MHDLLHNTLHCENDMVLKGKLIVNDGRSVNVCTVDSVPWLLENVKIKTLLLLPFNTVMHYYCSIQTISDSGKC